MNLAAPGAKTLIAGAFDPDEVERLQVQLAAERTERARLRRLAKNPPAETAGLRTIADTDPEALARDER